MIANFRSLLRLVGRQVNARMSSRSVVLLALLSVVTMLACHGDPLSLDGTGGLTITVVPYEGAQAEASAASDAASTAAAPPRRDLLRVTVNGPEFRIQDFLPNADGSVNAIIDNLLAGSYSVELLGIDFELAGELVSEYGINNSVTVLAEQTTDAVISFGSFLPVIDPTLPAQTSEFVFDVSYTAIPSATGYFFELDTDPSFPAPTTLSHTATSVVITAVALGDNWMRVTAENSSVLVGQGKPSDPVLVQVVADVNFTGDDPLSAPSLGVGRGANGQYSNFNIFPATDEDWFAIDLTTDATLTVDVLAESLTSPPPGGAGAALAVISAAAGPSPLDPVVDIFDPSGLIVIATNDDRDGTTFESRVSDVPIPVAGTYFIRVTSFLGASVGHYELLVFVNGVGVLGTAHSSTMGNPGPASLYAIDPATGAGTLIGAIGFNRVGAIDRHPTTGVYYAAAQTSVGATPVLITIDPATGVGTEIGPTGIPGAISDLSFHSDGTLYGHDATSGVHGLHTFDLLTGAASPVGLTGLVGGGNGLTFDAAGTLFLSTTTAGDIATQFSLAATTGLPTSIGTFSFVGAACAGHGINAIDFDPINATFYASVRCDGFGNNAFGIIDMVTRVVTIIGPSVSGLDGIFSAR